MRTAARASIVAAAALAAACGGDDSDREPGAPPLDAASSESSSEDGSSLVARVDAAGYFEIEDLGVAEAYSASPSVRAVSGRLGRVEPPNAADARVAVRLADGSLETRGLALRRAGGSLREKVLAALRARTQSWGTERTPGAFARLFESSPGTLVHGGEAAPFELPPRAEDADGSPPPADRGADLAAWAPADRVFVRFRSVEAAYRFCAEADRLAARLLAAQGDGRDRGTLRWALHDLLLPTIWRTNPQGERGVGECAVILDTPDVRGRAGVAALFRITDADLHRMQVLAGIGQEAEADHLWRPESDPFPEERDRRNVREVRADVEWVATTEDAFTPLRSAKIRRLTSDPEWRRARGDAAPVRDEAFFLFVPDDVRRGADVGDGGRDAAAHSARETRGLAALARTWAGISAAADAGDAAPQGRSPLRGLVSVRATTDAKGALVEAVFVDESAAAAAEEVFAVAARPLANAGDVCRTNLRDIVPLAVCESVPAKDVAERSLVVLGWRPVCPCRGTYLVHPVTRETSCSLHGTAAKPLPEPPAPGPLLRDLARAGTAVRFRWPIDWDRRE